MGTYNLPRNVKGEGRILFIFSTKSIVTTSIGALFGLIFYFIFNIIGLKMIGIIITLIFAAIGYSIGMLKVPETNGLEITRKTGGENIDDVLKRYIKFKKNNKKLYVYTKEEDLNG
ncbi:MAG: PrgI family protein [Clostridia bacterium]|nr:PrgI family protein [Clostridia bacterium]